jgi:Uma2 family endonuclease
MKLIEQPKLPRSRRRSRAPAPRRMSEEQFVAWVGEKTRAEWVAGEVQAMPPVTDDHDLSVNWFTRVLGLFVESKGLGVVKGPEFMVRFRRQARRRLPDVAFVSGARLGAIRETYIDGAPDLIIEVVSVESAARDWREKYYDYEKAGVREYWIVDRPGRRMEAYALKRGKYVRIEPSRDAIQSTVVRGFSVKSDWILAERPVAVAVALRELGIRI